MDYLAALARWEELSQAIKHMQAEERSLREQLFTGTFPQPKEGVNNYPLPDGRTVKGEYKLNRNLDRKALNTRPKGWLPDEVLREVVDYKPTLVISGYKKMNTADRQLFDTVLEIKPGLPTLEVLAPKEAK